MSSLQEMIDIDTIAGRHGADNNNANVDTRSDLLNNCLEFVKSNFSTTKHAPVSRALSNIINNKMPKYVLILGISFNYRLCNKIYMEVI